LIIWYEDFAFFKANSKEKKKKYGGVKKKNIVKIALCYHDAFIIRKRKESPLLKTGYMLQSGNYYPLLLFF